MDDKYFSSYYNHMIDVNDEKILYNSKNGLILNLGKDKNDIYGFLNIKNKDFQQIEGKCLDYLVKNDFVVMSLEKEREEVAKRYNEVINKKELFLEILPTEQCNFRCIYCYEKFERGFMDEGTVEGVIKFAEKMLDNCTSMRVAWFGGEPLLAMDIIEKLSVSFMRLCEERHIPYFSSITTNGYFLTPDKWKILKKCHITNYQITIDGLEEIHDIQRISLMGKGTWSTIISNLRYFRDNIKTRTINIMIRTNITKKIYSQKERYLEFLKDEFSSDRRFNFFFHLAQDWGNLKENIKDEFCGEDEFFNMMEDAANKKLSLKVFRYFLTPESRVCFAGRRNAFVITSEGNIRKCSHRIDETDNCVGNVNNVTFIQKESNQLYYKKLPGECEKCKKLPLCYGLVCPAYSGSVLDTCGYDVINLEKLIKVLVLSDKNNYIKFEGEDENE